MAKFKFDAKKHWWMIGLIILSIIFIAQGKGFMGATLEPSMISYEGDRVLIETGRFKIDYPKAYQPFAEEQFLDAQNCWETHKAELGIENTFPQTILKGNIVTSGGGGYSNGDTIYLEATTESWDALSQQMSETWSCKPAAGMCCNAHEFVHHMLFNRYFPMWAHEGLATYIELKEPYNEEAYTITCKETGFDGPGLQPGIIFTSYKDLNNFQVDKDVFSYRTAACFWRMVEEKGGAGTIKKILQSYPTTEMDTAALLSHIQKYADITGIVERFGLPQPEILPPFEVYNEWNNEVNSQDNPTIIRPTVVSGFKGIAATYFDLTVGEAMVGNMQCEYSGGAYKIDDHVNGDSYGIYFNVQDLSVKTASCTVDSFTRIIYFTDKLGNECEEGQKTYYSCPIGFAEELWVKDKCLAGKFIDQGKPSSLCVCSGDVQCADGYKCEQGDCVKKTNYALIISVLVVIAGIIGLIIWKVKK